MPPNGWNEWSKYVLKELERLSDCYEGIRGDITDIKTEIATLKVKAGIWGAVGAMVPIAIMLVVQLLMG